MRRLILNSILLIIFISHPSCSDEEELAPLPPLTPFFLECNTTTEHFGNVLLNDEELLCWSNNYPFQISSQGSGNCGEGYEDIQNPYMAMEIILWEFDEDEPEYSKYKRYLTIGIPFACNDYSTQEKFFDLISRGKYSFSSTNEDLGKFIIEYRKDGEIYSSLYADNSESVVEILEVVKNRLSGKSAMHASMDVKLGFSCRLANNTGEKVIEINRAEISGRFTRMSPWGQEWDE